MITNGKGSATASMFSSFPSNSAFGKVLSNNMDDSSYIKSEHGVSHELLSKPKTAAFVTINAMRTKKEYKDCKVSHYDFKTIVILKYSSSKMSFTKISLIHSLKKFGANHLEQYH